MTTPEFNPRSRRPVPSSTWRTDLKHVTWLHLGLTNVREHFYAAVSTDHAVDAHGTWLATCHAKGRVHAAIGQNAGRHGF